MAGLPSDLESDSTFLLIPQLPGISVGALGKSTSLLYLGSEKY